jgi:hypothetical protein
VFLKFLTSTIFNLSKLSIFPVTGKSIQEKVASLDSLHRDLIEILTKMQPVPGELKPQVITKRWTYYSIFFAITLGFGVAYTISEMRYLNLAGFGSTTPKSTYNVKRMISPS